MRNTYSSSVGKPECKRPLGRFRFTSEDVKLVRKKILYEDVE
jgi:hypothetical protein